MKNSSTSDEKSHPPFRGGDFIASAVGNEFFSVNFFGENHGRISGAQVHGGIVFTQYPHGLIQVRGHSEEDAKTPKLKT